MLVLSRKPGQRIMIGDDIVVEIVSVNRRNGKVRVAIEAPQAVPVNREEVYRALHQPKPEEGAA